MSQFDEPIFILGVERSGSTWLGNLFNSSPRLDFYMEPFVRRLRLFRAWPDRTVYLSEISDELRDSVRQKFRRLSEFKYAGFESFGAPAWLRKLNRYFLFSGWHVTKALTGQPSLNLHRYYELSLNRWDNPEVSKFSKVLPPENAAIKELRLNFKIKALERIFPEGRVTVIIRNPISQIHSMLRQFKKGSLNQLRRVLKSFPEVIAGDRRFDRFRFLKTIESESLTLAHRCLIYWFLNYNILIEDLSESQLEWDLVKHEALCEEPKKQMEALFEKFDLYWTGQTGDYLNASTSRDSSTSSPVDTSRESSRYHLEALDRVPEQLSNDLLKFAEPFWEDSEDEIVEYRDWLDQYL